MAKRPSLKDAMEKYKGGGNNDFFQLKNDKDTAIVRFLYGENEDELDYYVVFEAEIGGKKRWILHDEDPNSPLLKAGYTPVLKIWMQLVDDTDGKVKTWERGRNFVPKILGQINRYGALYKRKFEVERNGAKGDTNTTYELYPLDPDDAKFDDLPEKQELVNGDQGFILELTHEQQQQVVDGTFKPQGIDPGRSNKAGGGSSTPASERQTPPSERQSAPQKRPERKTGGDVF